MYISNFLTKAFLNRSNVDGRIVHLFLFLFFCEMFFHCQRSSFKVLFSLAAKNYNSSCIARRSNLCTMYKKLWILNNFSVTLAK